MAHPNNSRTLKVSQSDQKSKTPSVIKEIWNYEILSRKIKKTKITILNLENY